MMTDEERQAERDEWERVRSLDLEAATAEIEVRRARLAEVEDYLATPAIVRALAAQHDLKDQITDLARHIFRLENARDNTEAAESRRVSGLLKRLKMTRVHRRLGWACYQSGPDVRFITPMKEDPEGLAIILAGLDREGFKYTNTDGRITVQRQPARLTGPT